MEIKPPIGIESEKFWKERRLSELESAIERYVFAGYSTTEEPVLGWWLESVRLYSELSNEIDKMRIL